METVLVSLPTPDVVRQVALGDHGISSGTAVWNHDGRRGAFAVYDVEPGVLQRVVHTWDGNDFVEGGPR